jgi:hypothetical protein
MSVLSITIHSRIFGPQTDHDGLGLWCITPPSINISVISGGGGGSETDLCLHLLLFQRLS